MQFTQPQRHRSCLTHGFPAAIPRRPAQSDTARRPNLIRSSRLPGTDQHHDSGLISQTCRARTVASEYSRRLDDTELVMDGPHSPGTENRPGQSENHQLAAPRVTTMQGQRSTLSGSEMMLPSVHDRKDDGLFELNEDNRTASCISLAEARDRVRRSPGCDFSFKYSC
jgi:hypothetical protein